MLYKFYVFDSQSSKHQAVLVILASDVHKARAILKTRLQNADRMDLYDEMSANPIIEEMPTSGVLYIDLE